MPRYSLKALLVAISCIAFLFGGVRIALNLFLSSMDGAGPVSSSADWPLELRYLLDDPGVPERESIQVYCLHSFFDTEHIWRMRSSPALLEKIISEWQLTPIENVDVSSRIWQLPPSWWPKKEMENAEFYQTPGFLPNDRGQDGIYAFVIHDNANDQFFVWCKMNF